MSCDLSNKTVLVYDHGYNLEMALRLSRDFGRTLYFKPWKTATPKYRPLCIGAGYESVERVIDFWDVVDEVDLFVFPWVYDGDLQLHLESMGKRVWGSRKAERYEFQRGLFLETLKEVGLPVPEYEEITGMKALRKFMEEHEGEEWFVKLELLRGDRETFKLDHPVLCESNLREMEYYYAEFGDYVKLVVVKGIDTKIEIGYDGFTIDGQFTDGYVDYEIKNKCCIASFTPYDDMDENVRLVNEKFGPKLAEERARSAWGTEIRVGEGGEPYFIDATPRMPSPPGELMLEQIDNLSEILYHGAEGEFVQAECSNPIGVQVMIYAEWQDLSLLPVIIPPDIRRWVKLGPHFSNGEACFMVQQCGNEKLPWHREDIACVIGMEKNILSAAKLALERAHQVEGANLEIMESSLMDAVREIEEGQKQGIEFTETEIPEPAEVVE